MSPQAFCTHLKDDMHKATSADYKQMVADLEAPEVQQALQIDPSSDHHWHNEQSQDIDLGLCENFTSRQYDEDPTFDHWFQTT